MGEKSSSHHNSSKHRHHERNYKEERSSTSRKEHRHHRDEETREERSARKRKERHEDERESKHSRADGDGRRKRRHSKEGHRLKVVDDAPEDDLPRRKTFVDSESSRFEASTSTIPSSKGMKLQSHPQPSYIDEPAPLPKEPATVSSIKRDDWMLSGRGEEEQVKDKTSDAASSSDYFADLGTVSRVKLPKPDKPNPDNLKISSREINTQFAQGKHIDEYETSSASTTTQGGPGHQWRMMKLKRVYEAAEDESRNVEEVALERYGSMEAFNEARAERQYLDDQQSSGRDNRRQKEQGDTRPGPPSRPLSRQLFRKPGEASSVSSPQGMPPALSKRQSSFRQNGYDSEDPSKPSTPIPSVFTPNLSRAGSKLRTLSSEDESKQQDTASLKEAVATSQASASNTNPPLSAAALNKLSAKVMRAEMMGSGDVAELRAQLEIETTRAQSGGDQGFSSADASHAVGGEDANSQSHIQVLPTLDARGRLYDVGKGQPGQDEEGAVQPGNRRKKSGKFETRDAKTGELTRYNADDDNYTLADLVRQERFGAGSADQKNADAEMAVRITSDQAFKDNVDYMDENVERLARKKMKTDAMKRQFAVQGELISYTDLRDALLT
jgi:hypothetical protein